MKKYLLWGITGTPILLLVLLAYPFGGLMLNRLAYQQEHVQEKMNNIKGIETCESISPNIYETFLVFNESNNQTYYYRSRCYQIIAGETRDEALCDQVKERKSLFFNGSATSRAACLVGVKNQKAKDVSEIVKPESVHKIDTIEINRTPAGDFNVKVFLVGTLWGTYKFSVSLLDSDGDSLGNLEEITTHLSDRTDPLFTTIYRNQIQNLLGSNVQSGQKLNLRVTLKLLYDDAKQLQKNNLSTAQIESAKEGLINF